MLLHFAVWVFSKDFTAPANHATDAAFTHKEVVRFFRQHEFGCACQRIKTAFSQSTELELAVAVGEHGKAEER